ncbi:MAG: hypothetical protein JNK48_30155 [Bryobacterales bacterium]|nr:hypothetical protein [Bryobacterales bacterium]
MSALPNTRLTAGTFAVVAAIALAAIACLLVLQSPKPAASPHILFLALSPTGEWMASAGAAGDVRLWQEKRMAHARTLPLADGALNDLQFSPDGRFLAVASRNLILYDLQNRSQRVIRDDQANYGTARFTSDSKTLLTVTGSGHIGLIDLHSAQMRPLYCCTSIWGEVAFTGNDRQIAWAGHWPGLLDRASGAVARFTQERQFEAFGPIATHGESIFIGSQDGRVYWWDLATRKLLGKSPPIPGYVRTLAVLGGRAWIAYSSAQGSPVHLWQPATGASRAVASARPAGNIVYHPVHGSVVFADSTGEIQFWDLPNQTRLR